MLLTFSPLISPQIWYAHSYIHLYIHILYYILCIVYVYCPYFTDKNTKAWREAKSPNWGLSLLAANKHKVKTWTQAVSYLSPNISREKSFFTLNGLDLTLNGVLSGTISVFFICTVSVLKCVEKNSSKNTFHTKALCADGHEASAHKQGCGDNRPHHPCALTCIHGAK